MSLNAKVLTPKVLRWLSIGSFSLAVGFLMYLAFEPSTLNNTMARFVVSLLVATLFAVFFFVFYPDQLEMRLPQVRCAFFSLIELIGARWNLSQLAAGGGHR
jgi:hypothetical protein